MEVSYNSKTKIPETNINRLIKDFFHENGKHGILILVIIIVYIGILIYLGKSDTGPRILEIILWTIFTGVALANIWFFKKPPPPLNTVFKPGFNKKTVELDVHVEKQSPQKHQPPGQYPGKFPGKFPEQYPGKFPGQSPGQSPGQAQQQEDKVLGKLKKQVYHIPNNKYNYLDGKAICKAYGGRLAKYDEMETAYENGANWCSYGWSSDQMALFPTQKKTWDKLQNKKGHENDCGRPGINGGYIDNPNVRFGVNCFGPKPDERPQDYAYMKSVNTPPRNQEDIEIDKKEAYWKKRINNVLVAPFNNDNWSAF